MHGRQTSEKPVFTRSFFMTRIVFYLAVAFFVRESVTPERQEVTSGDFAAWSATFPSRLDRAMTSEVAE